MKKVNINLILYILLFVFGGFLIFMACRQSNQSILASSLPLNFTGEYSNDGEEWHSLNKDTKLSAYDGNLILRGRFDMELPEGAIILFYLDHIGMSISVNGEDAFEFSNERFPEMCGRFWTSWDMPALAEDDVIEIRLTCAHKYGSSDAYNEFLDSIFMSNEAILKDYYEKKETPYRSFCIFVLVASILCIGTAVGFLILKLPQCRSWCRVWRQASVLSEVS